MPSERQLAANRRNGAKGGPKSDAGKRRSRCNSLKHGLTSAALVVLPEEHLHEYEEILRGFRASFNPCDDVENALVLRLAHAHWRSLRSRRVETGMLNVSASLQRKRAREWVENCPEHLNPHEAIGVGFMAMPPEQWQMYLRYDTAISREFFKTLDALIKLQRSRNTLRHAPPPAAGTESPAPPKTFAAGAGAKLSEPGIRSVSQSGAAAADLKEQQEVTREPENETNVKHPSLPASPGIRWTKPSLLYRSMRTGARRRSAPLRFANRKARFVSPGRGR